MMLNKKALSMIMIVAIMISAITLIVLFFYINSTFDNYQYSQSLIACNLLFSNIDGKPTYFGAGLDKINTKLIDEIAKQCSSKKVIIDEKTINLAADLVYDCFKKTGSGTDIFGAKVKGQKICLYCGEIEAKEEILDFNKKLNKEFLNKKYVDFYSNSSETLNMNAFNLQFSSNKLGTGESITVFYYLYKSEVPKNIDVSTWLSDEYFRPISKLVAENTGNFGSAMHYFTSDNLFKTYAGVILTKSFENKDKEDFEKFRNTINFQEDCTVIIPVKNFD